MEALPARAKHAAEMNAPRYERAAASLWCPSARPSEGVIFGVRVADANVSGIDYLDRLVEATDDILKLAEPLDPREIFRFAAPCAESQCAHFTGHHCSLIKRIVDTASPVVEDLPACRIRSRCRWFAEEAGEACRRCPGIITLQMHPDRAMETAAVPPKGSGTGERVSIDLPMPTIRTQPMPLQAETPRAAPVH